MCRDHSAVGHRRRHTVPDSHQGPADTQTGPPISTISKAISTISNAIATSGPMASKRLSSALLSGLPVSLSRSYLGKRNPPILNGPQQQMQFEKGRLQIFVGWVKLG